MQPQVFEPPSHSGKTKKTETAAPVSENQGGTDVKLEAGIEELGRALGFRHGSGEQETPVQQGDKGSPKDIETEGNFRGAAKKPELITDDAKSKRAAHDLTHTPYDPQCPICQSAEARRSSRKRKTPDDSPDVPVKKFGDL